MNGVSFYGSFRAGGGSGGGGGTTDYDKLYNKPIATAKGTQDAPIQLQTLPYGVYSLSGYYKEDAEGQVMTVIDRAPRTLTVTKDTETNQKVIFYSQVKDNTPMIVLLTYSDDDKATKEEISCNQANIEWTTF